MTEAQSDMAANLARVRGRIIAAALASGRAGDSVDLIAVSKTVPAERIEAALAVGQRLFGENRVQEAKSKWPELMARFPHIELHLIGPLQTNKARDAVALAQAIHSLDRPQLADALADAMARLGRRPFCFVQVNTGREPQKAGVLPESVDALIRHAIEVAGLAIAGLMCIPPAEADPGPHFDMLAAIAQRHHLAKLSMGMSGDFEHAIRHGATHVRIGTAIFGAR